MCAFLDDIVCMFVLPKRRTQIHHQLILNMRHWVYSHLCLVPVKKAPFNSCVKPVYQNQLIHHCDLQMAFHQKCNGSYHEDAVCRDFLSVLLFFTYKSFYDCYSLHVLD